MYKYQSIHVQIVQDINEAVHLHPDVELFYVLEGEVQVRIRDKSYFMGKEDILLVNSGILHSTASEDGSILCVVTYDYQVIADILKKAGVVFLCNSVSEQEKSYEELQEVFRELVYLEILYNRKSESYKYSLLYRILDLLIENYMLENCGSKLYTGEYGNDEKLQAVVHYVYKNFQDKVSLSVLAEQMYLSTSTLSRFFKKQTGIYFAEYVNQVRLKYAINELLYSEKNITKVAMDCGFSNVSTFNKIFRENFHMAPSEYRKEMREKVEEDLKQVAALHEKLRGKLQEQISIPKGIAAVDKESADIHGQDGQVYKKFWKQAINIGSIHSLTLTNVQYHLLYLMEQLGFHYVRVWSIFSKNLMLCDGRTIGTYNYDTIDIALDFLVSHHIAAYLDFGKRPSTAVKSAGDTVYYEDEGICFQSKRAWEAMFEDFLNHVLIRYGKEEVSKWIFEISRDPSHLETGKYYEDPDYDICTVYQFAYRTIKEVLPDAKIGGLGWSVHKNNEIMEHFLGFCRESGCIPDYITVVLFPYIVGQPEDDKPYKRSPDQQFELGKITQARRLMQQFGMGDCELYVSEWNQSISNRNYLNDSCFRGVYFCKKISEIWDTVDMLCVWVGSDWVSNYYDSFCVANGGAGLLTKDGIRKPAFYALQFLNLLGDRFVTKGEHYIVTKSESGSYRILCFNFNWYSIKYFLKSEDSILPQELDSIFIGDEPIAINLALNGLEENRSYIIKKRSISQENGSILDEWKRFQYETHLERADIKYLQEICIPHLCMEKRKAEKGKLHLHVRLKMQEFAFYHIYKE